MRAVRALIVTAVAACGLLAAHWLDYVIVVPDPAHRHDLLFRTGHGYLPTVISIVAAAGLVAALASTALGLTGHGTRDRGRRLLSDILLLATVQTGAFVALESLERVLSRLASDERFFVVIAVGAALQVLTASLATLVVRLLERAGEVIRDRLVAARPEQIVLRRSAGAEPARLRAAVLNLARAPRAPPPGLAS